MSKSPELLPCPFCGGEPTEAIESNGYGVFWVICDNVKNNSCGCEGPYRRSEADAVAAWNRRTALRSVPPTTPDTGGKDDA